MHEKEEWKGKCYLKVVVPVVVGLDQAFLSNQNIVDYQGTHLGMTYFLFTYLQSPIWIGSCMILSWKSFPLYDQSWKIIIESLWSIPWTNNKMRFFRMDDLGSEMKGTGTNTDLSIWRKLSLVSRVSFNSRVSPNQKVEIHILFPSMEWDFPKLVVQFQN